MQTESNCIKSVYTRKMDNKTRHELNVAIHLYVSLKDWLAKVCYFTPFRSKFAFSTHHRFPRWSYRGLQFTKPQKTLKESNWIEHLQMH